MSWKQFWEQPRESPGEGWAAGRDSRQPRPYRTGEREGWSLGWICKRLAWVAGVQFLVLFAFLFDKGLDNAVPGGRHPFTFALQTSLEVMLGAMHPAFASEVEFYVSMLILQAFALGVGVAILGRRSRLARTTGYLAISLHFCFGLVAVLLD